MSLKYQFKKQKKFSFGGMSVSTLFKRFRLRLIFNIKFYEVIVIINELIICFDYFNKKLENMKI